jgi:hypothetical protein
MLKDEGENVCIPKECDVRIPWENKTCSMKEDFVLISEDGNENEDGNTVDKHRNEKCYYYERIGDGYGRCVSEEECPSDYPPV